MSGSEEPCPAPGVARLTGYAARRGAKGLYKTLPSLEEEPGWDLTVMKMIFDGINF